MHLYNQRILGIAILFLSGILVIVKQVAAGSMLDKPKGNRTKISGWVLNEKSAAIIPFNTGRSMGKTAS
jgi:hypothetical protein